MSLCQQKQEGELGRQPTERVVSRHRVGESEQTQPKFAAIIVSIGNRTSGSCRKRGVGLSLFYMSVDSFDLGIQVQRVQRRLLHVAVVIPKDRHL